MDKLLKKLSIKPKGKESPFSGGNVDAEFVSKMYRLEKEKERRKEGVMTSRRNKF